jgi:hypothetical protein
MQWSRSTLCGYQNQPCVPSDYQSGYLLPYPTRVTKPTQIKTILWLSAVVMTDVVRVSEPAVCTLRLSVRVFTPLPDRSEKTQNPSFDILNLGSRKFLYITAGSFGSGGGGGGKGFYIHLWCGGRGMRSDRHSFPSDGCPWTKWHLGVALWSSTKNTIRGKLVVSPKFRPLWVLWVYVCIWFVRAPKMF